VRARGETHTVVYNYELSAETLSLEVLATTYGSKPISLSIKFPVQLRAQSWSM